MKKLLIIASLIVFPSLVFAQTFDRNLYYGLRNDPSVQQLQEFLTDQGIYSGPITGNFFSLTLTAVKKYQSQNNITPAAGFFGPLTRAKVNTILASQINASNQQAIKETGTTPTQQAPQTPQNIQTPSQPVSQAPTQPQTQPTQTPPQTQPQNTPPVTQQNSNTYLQQLIIPEQSKVISIPIISPVNQSPQSKPLSTVSISSLENTTFNLTNNGPDNIFVNKLRVNLPNSDNGIYICFGIAFLNPSVQGEEMYTGLAGGWAKNSTVDLVVDWSSPFTSVESKVRRWPVNGKFNLQDQLRNEVKPGETIRVIVNSCDGRYTNIYTPVSVVYVPGSIIEKSTGRDIPFSSFGLK